MIKKETFHHTSLRQSLVIQSRVIGALLLREIITRYGRHNIGFMWLFGEPMMFTLGVTTLWTFAKMAHSGSLPIVAFCITGYSSLLIWRNTTMRCGKAIEPNLALLYHRNVKVIDVFAARIILEIAGATLSLTILSLVFSAVGLMELPADIVIAFAGWLLLAWFAGSLGLIVGSLSERSETVERLWHTLTYLMFPMSGAVFMVQWLPQQWKEYILWVPMVNGTEMVRHGFFGNAVRTYEDPAYLIVVNLVLMLIGLSLVKETGRRVEQQ